MRSGLHHSVWAPLMELEDSTRDDRQRCNSAQVAREPFRHRRPQVGFTSDWPEEADGSGIGLRQPAGYALAERSFLRRTIGEYCTQRECALALQLSRVGTFQSPPHRTLRKITLVPRHPATRHSIA
jgi:hypothetical protein